jgi:hypothetical protein
MEQNLGHGLYKFKDLTQQQSQKEEPVRSKRRTSDEKRQLFCTFHGNLLQFSRQRVLPQILTGFFKVIRPTFLQKANRVHTLILYVTIFWQFLPGLPQVYLAFTVLGVCPGVAHFVIKGKFAKFPGLP